MLTLISQVIAGLAAILIALTVAILIVNRVFGERIERARFFSSKMEPALEGYLAGSVPEATVIDELEQDRETALECLVKVASSLPASERPRLRVFFDHFWFLEELMEQIGGKDWSASARAATLLGYAGNRECLPLLLKALNHEMLDVRLAAARALAQLKAGDCAEPILRSLALPGNLPQQCVAEILCEMGEAAVDPMLGFLRKNHGEEETAAIAAVIRALGLLKADKAAPEIIALLEHPDSEVRLNSARTLGHIGSPMAINPLLKRLRDPVWEVRSAAVKALGYLGYPMAIPSVQTALQDAAWWVRYNAAEALFRMGGAGVSALKEALSTSPDRFARDMSRQILEEHGVATVPAGGTKL